MPDPAAPPKPHSHHSLRSKAVVIFFGLSLGPLLLMGGLAWSAINSTHRQDVATMETQLLSQKIAETKKFLSDISGLFDIRVAYEQTSIIAQTDQQFLLQKLLEDNNYILEASLVDLTGQETAKNSRIQDPQLIPLQNVNQVAAFQSAKNGDKYFGDVHYTLNGPIMTIAGPVTNRNGQVIMVLMGEISLGPLQQNINIATLGTFGYVYLLDQQASVIATANPDLAQKNLGAEPWVAELIKGKLQTGLAPADQRLNFAGDQVLAAGRPVGNLGWSMVAEWPKADAYSVISQIQNQVLLLSVLALLAVIILGWIIGRRILGPLASLRQAAAKIGEGVFDFKTNIHTRDELEELGETFNRMTVDLKRLQELKEEFVFVAAHELRTPVTAIKGYLSMILNEELDPVSEDVKQLLRQVTAANQRLVQLVEDLLQVARSDAGKLTIAIAPVAVGPVVETVLKELLPLAKDKQIELVYQASAELPQAEADADRLKEVLINLVGNAIKYTPNQGRVTISHEASAGLLMTRVTDTGIGMTAEEQLKLFEKFYRIKNADTAKISGTGLGLFIVKQIVEKMGGKIWASSEKGQGSTFSFSLALAAGPTAPVPPTTKNPA